MGVTIHYRGSLADLDRIVDFEDRVLDLALELGGQAKIWRSKAKENPRGMVRGILLNLCPGQETTSLLISPEGWLINLFDIEDAENGKLAEPPYCFIKTQHGAVEGHVALIEMLTLLKREFLPNLEVTDEGEYWETRNLETLVAKFKQIEAAMNAMTEGMEKFPLTDEAAEDPEILIHRIQRIAGLVHRTLSRPAEHPPASGGNELGLDGAEESEPQWDESYKENRRRQERVQRTIEEHLARGENFETAFESAMLEETAAGLPEDPSCPDRMTEWLEEISSEVEEEADEPWKESLRQSHSSLDEVDNASEDDDMFPGMKFHPLQRRAHDLMHRIYDLSSTQPKASLNQLEALLQGVADIVGGLVQALDPEDCPMDYGLSIVQLKRALRGAAYALGSLFPLRTDGLLDQPTFEELHQTIEALQTDIYDELTRYRERSSDGF
jgi:hypothetical protein